MRIKKRIVLIMILLSLFISASLIGCEKKQINNNTIKNESVNSETEDKEAESCGTEDNDTEDSENNSGGSWAAF